MHVLALDPKVGGQAVGAGEMEEMRQLGSTLDGRPWHIWREARPTRSLGPWNPKLPRPLTCIHTGRPTPVALASQPNSPIHPPPHPSGPCPLLLSLTFSRPCTLMLETCTWATSLTPCFRATRPQVRH